MYTKLRALMFENNISSEDIAKILNLHRNTVSNKIRGKAVFTTDQIIAIRDTFFPNISLDVILRKAN